MSMITFLIYISLLGINDHYVRSIRCYECNIYQGNYRVSCVYPNYTKSVVWGCKACMQIVAYTKTHYHNGRSSVSMAESRTCVVPRYYKQKIMQNQCHTKNKGSSKVTICYCTGQDFCTSASFKIYSIISLLIAKNGEPNNIAENLILPALKEVPNVMKQNSDQVLKHFTLSSSTVKRRMDQTADNVEKILINELKSFKFSFQLDESIFRCENILMSYVRYFSKSKQQIIDKFLLAKYLTSDSRGITIFNTAEQYFIMNEIPLENIFTVATDGALSMVGRNHLVAKNLSRTLKINIFVKVKVINKIKSKPLNSRLFSLLYKENDKQYTNLLVHTDVLLWTLALFIIYIFVLVLLFIPQNNENYYKSVTHKFIVNKVYSKAGEMNELKSKSKCYFVEKVNSCYNFLYNKMYNALFISYIALHTSCLVYFTSL
ncbi:hypothetical protein A3Q56_03432 [Intoshia linei]|uniref:DUF4371 domain-containing protein n=1 Tax=Intoshia linei TaxID=1819745 RepID=A0A177B3L2_9BILA|nr:hypothetical protein A3Q56_03432 [Intoshia linei]